jgi:zinc protease
MHSGKTVGMAAAFATLLGFAPVNAVKAAPLIAPNVGTFTLANGMQVVVIPDHRAPVVTHMVWYKVGAADEERGHSGIAHFLEHLMFKGTKAHPEGEFSTTVAEVGGSENAFTTSDYTAYFQTVAKENLPTMMEFEADRMTGLVLTDAVVLPERDVILEERRSRTDNDPGAQLAEAVSAALYQNHPYGIPVIGWKHEMEKLSRDDAIAFYNRYYTPNNAILVVAGDVTVDEVRGLAEATYGKVARRADPGPRIRAQEPPPVAARTVTLDDPRVSQPAIQRVYLTPSYGSGELKEALALDVLADILGGGPTSRLYRALVVEEGVAASAGAYYQGTALDDSRFGVYGVPRGKATLDDVDSAIDRVLAKIRQDGITEDELAAAKKRVLALAVFAQDRQGGLARMFGSALATGQSVTDIQEWPTRIQGVTAEDVKAVAGKYLDLKRSVTGYLVNTAAAAPAAPAGAPAPRAARP